MPGIIIAHRPDRLGGRLLSLYASIHIAQTYDLPLKIHWPAFFDFEVNHYQELFDEQFIRQNFISNDEVEALRPVHLPWGPTDPIARVVTKNARNVIIDIATLPRQSLEFPKKPFLEALGLHPDILATIAGLRTRLKRYEAMHIRYGDLLLADRVFGKSSPIEYYAHLLENFPFEAKDMILFTDTPPLAEYLKKRYPLILPDEVFNGIHLTDLQRAFLDIYLMSQAESIWSGGTSNFSYVASMVGDRPLSYVTAVQPEVHSRVFSMFLGEFNQPGSDIELSVGKDLVYHNANFFLHRVSGLGANAHDLMKKHIYEPRRGTIWDAPKFGKTDRLLLELSALDPAEYARSVDECSFEGQVPTRRMYGDEMLDTTLDFLRSIQGIIFKSSDPKTRADLAIQRAGDCNIIFNNRRTLRRSSYELSEVLARMILASLPDPEDLFNASLWDCAWPEVQFTRDCYFRFNTPRQFKEIFLILSSVFVKSFNSLKHVNVHKFRFKSDAVVLDALDSADSASAFVLVSLYLALNCHRTDQSFMDAVSRIRDAYPHEIIKLDGITKGKNTRLGNCMPRLFPGAISF